MDEIIISEEVLQHYELLLKQRWSRNTQRILKELPPIFHQRIEIDDQVKLLLKQELSRWVESPKGKTETGWMIAGSRVIEGDTLIANMQFIELTRGMFEPESFHELNIHYGVAGYALFEGDPSFANNDEIEPLAFIHNHPHHLGIGGLLEFSQPDKGFIKGLQSAGPLISLGLGAVEDGVAKLKLGTVVGGGEIHEMPVDL